MKSFFLTIYAYDYDLSFFVAAEICDTSFLQDEIFLQMHSMIGNARNV